MRLERPLEPLVVSGPGESAYEELGHLAALVSRCSCHPKEGEGDALVFRNTAAGSPSLLPRRGPRLQSSVWTRQPRGGNFLHTMGRIVPRARRLVQIPPAGELGARRRPRRFARRLVEAWDGTQVRPGGGRAQGSSLEAADPTTPGRKCRRPNSVERPAFATYWGMCWAQLLHRTKWDP